MSQRARPALQKTSHPLPYAVAGTSRNSGATLSDLQIRANAHSGNSTLTALQRLADSSAPVQRTVISRADVPGLTADIDTSQPDTAITEIDKLWNGGRRKALVALYYALGTGFDKDSHPRQNKALRKHIDAYIKKSAGDDAEYGNANIFDRTLFDYRNAPADKTGMVAGAPPRNATDEQKAAMAVRIWQAGDTSKPGLSWTNLGKSLQDRLGDRDVSDALVTFAVPDPPAKDESGNDTDVAAYRKDKVKEGFEGVADRIGKGLDFLPKYDGKSYRVATSRPGVMGGPVTTGTLIKNKSFLSTSALKSKHLTKDFGAEGTPEAPQVYYIIEGSSGVFLPSFTGLESGAREVLFKNETVFRVKQIHNYRDATFFVTIMEVDPATLSADDDVKNPWTGESYPKPPAG